MMSYRDNLRYILFSLIPILCMYSLVDRISIGDVLLLAFLVGTVILNNELSIENGVLGVFVFFFFVAIYNLFTTFMAGLNISQSINNSIVIMLFGVELAFSQNKKNEIDRMYFVSSIVCVCLVLFLVLQWFCYYMLGIVITGNVFGFKLIDNLFFVAESRGRLSSLLGEPAHLSIYIAPIYVTSILKKDIRMIVICVLGLLLSTSSTGLIIIAAIPLSYLLLSSSIDSGKKISILFMMIIAFVIGYCFITNYYDNYSSKFSLDSLSTNIRIFGQIENIKKMDIFQLIFGVGLNNWAMFMERFSVETLNYSNSFLYAIMSFGMFGFFSLMFAFGHFTRMLSTIEKNKSLSLYFLILLFVFITDQVLFNRNLLYLLIWMSGVSNLKVDYQEEGDNLEYAKFF